MASSTPHTIVLSDQPFIQEEKLADNVALKPGDLIQLKGSDVTRVQLHSTAGGNAQAMFVLENPYAEPSATVAAIDTSYGTIDTVRFIVGRSGDIVYGWLTGATVAVGAYLESAGSLGGLRAVTSGTTNHQRVIGKALSAAAAAPGVKARIQVEIV